MRPGPEHGPIGLKSRQLATAGWHLSLYPDAREAAGVFRVTSDWEPGRRGTPGESCQPERTRKVAAGRAGAKLRRYVVANGLNRLGTLTYAGAGCHDPVVLRRDAGEFFRKLRSALGGRPFPYAWVPEWHPGGHGLHVHFAVGRFVLRSLIVAAWGRGLVHIKLLGDLPVGSGAVGEARMAAGYLAKYVSKSFDERRVAGLHRYEVAQHFQPRVVVIEAAHLGDLVTFASNRMGSFPADVSHSDRWESWSGPTAVVMTWDS